jgi:putative transposase
LDSGQKREIMIALRQDYPVSVICAVLDYPRSQVYYEPASSVDETDLKQLIQMIAGAHPTYGYRRITAELKRRGQTVNHKRVSRLMRELGILGKRPRKRKRTTDSNHRFPRYPNRMMGLSIEQPDQVWVGDITYIRLGQEFVYLAVLMDVFTRSIRGWHFALLKYHNFGFMATFGEAARMKGVPYRPAV